MATAKGPFSSSAKKRRQQVPLEQQVVEGLARWLWQVISWPFRQSGKPAAYSSMLSAQARKELLPHWEEVRWYAEQVHHQAQAVLEADKLFDSALQALGVSGTSMGERLKQAEPLFPAELYQEIWQAHKIRNQVAHEVGFVVQSDQVRYVLSVFARALRVIGLIEL